MILKQHPTHKTDQVYGINRDLPLNYVERPGIDQIFIDNLTRDKHLVIYGSSKQGKTSLRKHCLKDDDYVVVNCSNTMAIADLYGAILKAAGYQIHQATTKTVEGRWKFAAKFKGKGKVPLVAEVEGEGNVDRDRGERTEERFANLELDLADHNDIITALGGINFHQFVILEDFHYLPVSTQRNFSFGLKAFHEASKLCFVIVGVWREKNRLIYYNGDLTNRVISIDADEWKSEELDQVIAAGEYLLNIKFDSDFRRGLIENCFGSVHLVQEACHHACKEMSIHETCPTMAFIRPTRPAREIIKGIVDEQAGRYAAFLSNFSEGFQRTDLEMYRWLLYSIVAADQNQLARGLRRAEISSAIKARHPEGQSLNEGNITQALQNAADLQVRKDVRPLILDYDQTNRVLNIVDRSFLIWLAYQDKKDLLADLGIVNS